MKYIWLKTTLYLILIGLILLLVKIISIPRIEVVRLPNQSPLEKWVDKLGTKEKCPAEGIIDSNGLRSYGYWCYQSRTFVWFVQRTEMMPGATEKEILSKLSDYNTQRELTIRILELDPSAWTHWKTSVKKIGKPPLALK